MDLNVSILINGQGLELQGGDGVKMVKKALSYEKVGTNWSDYSQGFTVPASVINNKIFKHYYNPQVVDTFNPFDTNTCEIFINLQSIATGVVRIVSVNLQNNIPESYTVQFFSDNINLKEALKEKTIADIDWSIFNHVAAVANMGNYLNGTAISGAGVTEELFYPFVSTRSLLKWDNPNSLTYKEGVQFASSAGSGIYFDEFRPASPISFIMTKLFALAGFEVDNKLALDDTYNKTYLWLNNGEDFVSSSTGIQSMFSQMGSSIGVRGGSKLLFQNAIQNEVGMLENGGFRISIADTYDYTFSDYIGSSEEYQVRRVKNGSAGSWQLMGGAGATASFNEALSVGDYIYIEAQVVTGIIALLDSTCSLNVVSTTAHLSQMIVSTFVPKMEAVKFIQGVLDMFNALLYYDNASSKFIIQNRLDWLDAGETIDISRFIDTAKKRLRPPTFFNSFNFEMAQGNDVSSLFYKDKFQHSHGSTRYHTGNIFGEEFSRSLPFTIPLVNFINSDKADPTAGAQATYTLTTTTSVDKAYSRIDPNAMLFTKEGVRATGATWKVRDYTGASATGTNSNDFRVDTALSKSIGFGSTLSANGAVLRSDTLFKEYYASFITSFYNSGVKRYNMSAYIPFAILNQIQPNTVLTINTIDYRIDDITTDTKTGKSILNLITKTI